MQYSIERYSEKHRDEALADLHAELREFNYDGLIQLREDLTRHAVVRGSWAGCVISYKRGAPGSARRDRLGRARNAFTVLWDNGWLTDEEVTALVDLELARRRLHGTEMPQEAEPVSAKPTSHPEPSTASRSESLNSRAA